MPPSSGSVAPKERINIKYVPATGDQRLEVELPLKLLVTGDFKGRLDPLALEDRQPVAINKNTFDEVLAKADVHLAMAVPALLGNDPDATLGVHLRFSAIEDFSPDAIARQVPEMRQLLELRAALVALKGPIGNVPAFRKQLQALLGNEQGRERLASELDMAADAPGA
jgi:type VI secretion system protein ImpB